MFRICSDKCSLLVLFVLFFVGGAVYANSFQVPFYFDDHDNIVENSQLRIRNLSLQSVKSAAFSGPSSHRPVANLTFGLNYYFHRYDVRAYHAVNIFIHLVTSFLLYLFIIKTLQLSRYGLDSSTTRQVAFFVALLWVVHPVQTQSVTYIVQRMTSLSTMFYLASFLCYIRGREEERRKGAFLWFAGALFAGLLAFGSKQNTVILPLMLFIYEFYFFQDLNVVWLKKRLAYGIAAVVIIILLAFVFMGGSPFRAIMDGYAQRDFTLGERLLTQPRVIFHYLSLLIFPLPSRLNLDYDFEVSRSLLDPVTTLFSFGGIMFFVSMAFFLAKREKLLSFCIIWFFGNLVIESSIVPLEIVYEHRLYLPSMFFLLMVLLICYKYTARPMVISCTTLALVLVCAVWTIERNSVWKDPVAFWQDCITKSPNKARPRTQLGLALYKAGRVNEAVEQFNVSLLIDPMYIKTHNNLGNALQAQGKLRKAAYHYEQYLVHDINNEKVLNNLGSTYARLGDLNKAVFYLNRVLLMNSMNAEALNNMGNILYLQGRYDEAIHHFKKSLAINPDNHNARYNLQLAIKKANAVSSKKGL